MESINTSMESLLLRKYLKSLFIDTRLTDNDLSTQIYKEPKGFEEAHRLAKLYHLEWPREIRKSNGALYKLSIKIENIDDDIERLAEWAVYLDHQAG